MFKNPLLRPGVSVWDMPATWINLGFTASISSGVQPENPLNEKKEGTRLCYKFHHTYLDALLKSISITDYNYQNLLFEKHGLSNNIF